MKKKLFLAAVLFSVFSISVFAQDTSENSADSAKDKAAELRKAAVEYLRESPGEINRLRTSENRISFSSELANLMWFHDEQEARKMFEDVARDFVQLMTEANATLNALGGSSDEPDFVGPFMGSPTDTSNALRKIQTAVSVREQIALAIAEHDAQFGYDFVTRTAGIVTDEKLKQRIAFQEERLESKIIDQMSVTKPDESLAFARKSLKRGFKSELVTLAAKIYRKDPEGAIEFGKELVSKVKSQISSESESLENLHSILRVGMEEVEDGKKNAKPLFDQADLIDLAELLGKQILDGDQIDSYMIGVYTRAIKKYSPGIAGRIEAKQEAEKRKSKDDLDNKSLDVIDEAAVIKGLPDPANDSENPDEKQMLMEELGKLDEKELTSEQKGEFIEKARRIVSEMKNPTAKVFALSALAIQVKSFGDEKLAVEIMREANVLIKPIPTNYMDYMLVWSVATGYSKVAPDEAFLLLEDAIFRLNETVGAMVKVAEFVDVRGDFVIDREVQVGAFGGSMTRSVVGAISGSGSVLRDLSESDFERTKGLVQKIEQPEIRILVRFMVLRSLLKNDQIKGVGLVN
jgi:hypothetical protein